VTRSDADGTTKKERQQRSIMIRYVLLFMVALVGIIGAAFWLMQNFSTEQPQASLACATKLYSTYDPKNLEQCVAVCMACSNGVRTTCSTSCTLKGAR